MSQLDKKIGELEKALKELEKRISKLEKAIFTEKVKPVTGEFKGLSGGIRFLISTGFLNSPKSVREVREELKREGYHYSYDSVDKLLRVDFMAKQKILTRIREDGVWKYVVRK